MLCGETWCGCRSHTRCRRFTWSTTLTTVRGGASWASRFEPDRLLDLPCVVYLEAPLPEGSGPPGMGEKSRVYPHRAWFAAADIGLVGDRPPRELLRRSADGPRLVPAHAVPASAADFHIGYFVILLVYREPRPHHVQGQIRPRLIAILRQGALVDRARAVLSIGAPGRRKRLPHHSTQRHSRTLALMGQEFSPARILPA
jgi:hypothetical protein